MCIRDSGSAGKVGVSLAAVLAVLAAITNMLTATHTEMTAMRPPPIVLPFSIVLKTRLTAPSSPRWMAFSKPNRAFIPLPPAVNLSLIPIYLEYIPDADLSDVTPAELRAQLSVPMGSEGSAIVPADQQGLLTSNALSAKLEENKSAIDALEQQKEDIRNARSKELAGLKAQIDALQTTLEAVSYTHLDVYKRQGTSCASPSTRPTQRVIPAFTMSRRQMRQGVGLA